MFVERMQFSGGWIITDVVDGYLVTRRYYFHTRAEAVASYKEEFPNAIEELVSR